MPLIPIYAARRRILDADGTILIEDFRFSFGRISRAEAMARFNTSCWTIVDPADVPACDLAAPPGSRVILARGLVADDLLVVPCERGGCASVELAPREAVDAAREGLHGLSIVRRGGGE